VFLKRGTYRVDVKVTGTNVPWLGYSLQVYGLTDPELAAPTDPTTNPTDPSLPPPDGGTVTILPPPSPPPAPPPPTSTWF
jgi:hypothetical protein